MNLRSMDTKDIWEELKRREGVTTVPIEPHVKVEVAGVVVEGPAMILIHKA
ncbi:BC1881 family protein [Bacillus thuringiensis]|uniref:BC1881 family protein n=1 Tax=Bacillus thuringiensis TaxID=1428 RepID=UPI0011A9C9BC|nr:BC1881 family protein [Bacillus thuringiensis]